MNTLIKDGIVIDGTGTTGEKKDILIKGERIETIGNLKDINADKTIKAKGLAVCPGFIDAHAHLDWIMAHEGDSKHLKPLVAQGITTAINGQCGISPAPVAESALKDLSRYWGNLFSQKEWPDIKNCKTMETFLEFMQNNNPLMNLAQFIGHFTVRASVRGFKSGKSTSRELAEMRKIVNDSMESGAIGVSFGLEYVCGAWSDTEELIAICKDLPKYNGRIAMHLRSKSIDILKATEEAIKIAETVGVPLQISHYGVVSEELEEFFGALKIIEDAQKRGVKIGIDLLTYANALNTSSFLWLPHWILEGGTDKTKERLSNNNDRQKLRDYFIIARINGFNTWETQEPVFNKWAINGGSPEKFLSMLKLSNFKIEKNRKYEKWTLKDIAIDLNKDPYFTFFDLLVEEDLKLYMSLKSDMGKENSDKITRNSIQIYSLPYCSIGGDIIGTDKGEHPGSHGTFPRFIGRVAREWGVFSIEEAVRKCTSLPAEQHGIENRGLIKEGMFADLIIFNPETIIDKATNQNPNLKSEGINMVFVNGNIVVENGEYIGDKGYGKVIK